MTGPSAPVPIVDLEAVTHAASWRETTYTLTFVQVDRELDGQQLLDVCHWAHDIGLDNPRVITPRFLAWSSLFQPTLSVARRGVGPLGSRVEIGRFSCEPHLLWLQSMVFLAGVTLSAAIVQGRWSCGTLESKFDRLWQAASAKAFPTALDRESLRKKVIDLARRDQKPIETLLTLRREFLLLAGELSAEVPSVSVEVSCDRSIDTRRFGFVDELVSRLPGTLCLIAYGSSVSSENFADIDLVLIADDAEVTLRLLENRCPSWRGKELNISVYAQSEFKQMQLLSGDNLADYGYCIFGKAAVPQKERSTLLARNLSFGIVRQRQQLGMVASAARALASDGDDRRNLYDYFVKIPLNVAKGTFGGAGLRRSKEDMNRWLFEKTGFDTAREQSLAGASGPTLPLARAAVATGEALVHLNKELDILAREP